MKKIGILFTGLLLLSICATASANNLTKKVEGVWTVKVADAPYGYQDYQVTIKIVDGKYLADIASPQLNLKDHELKEVDGKLTTTVYAGEEVKVLIWEEENSIQGTADTSMGKLPIGFTPVKKAE